jgi:hypothetical protein
MASLYTHSRWVKILKEKQNLHNDNDHQSLIYQKLGTLWNEGYKEQLKYLKKYRLHKNAQLINSYP